MPITRRAVLRIVGSSAVILAAGGAGFALTRTPTKALAPWQRAGSSYEDPRLRALSYAILAPNPHNRQPWLVDLGRDDEITLICELDRRLPQTDPFDRQIAIGLGCFLELLRIAAAEDGFEARIEPFPAGGGAERLDQRPVARIQFVPSPGLAKDALFAEVLARRSNKEPYDMTRPVSNNTLAALVRGSDIRATTGTTNDPHLVERLRDIAWRAHEVESRTPRTMQESIDLMRIGKAEIERQPDGIDLGGVFLESLNRVGLMTREAMADPGSTAFEQGLELYQALIGSAMGFVWQTSRGNGREDQLAAGRAWLRCNLAATALGLGLQPLSQALQEYPEMAALRAELREALAVPEGETLQMFARLGYGPAVAPSPRWGIETRIRPA